MEGRRCPGPMRSIASMPRVALPRRDDMADEGLRVRWVDVYECWYQVAGKAGAGDAL